MAKAIACLERRTKIPAGVRAKVIPGALLDYAAAKRGLVVLLDGRQRPIGPRDRWFAGSMDSQSAADDD